MCYIAIVQLHWYPYLCRFHHSVIPFWNCTIMTALWTNIIHLPAQKCGCIIQTTGHSSPSNIKGSQKVKLSVPLSSDGLLFLRQYHNIDFSWNSYCFTIKFSSWDIDVKLQFHDTLFTGCYCCSVLDIGDCMLGPLTHGQRIMTYNLYLLLFFM